MAKLIKFEQLKSLAEKAASLVGSLAKTTADAIEEVSAELGGRVQKLEQAKGGYTWYADTDEVLATYGELKGANLLLDTKERTATGNNVENQTGFYYQFISKYNNHISDYARTVTLSFDWEASEDAAGSWIAQFRYDDGPQQVFETAYPGAAVSSSRLGGRAVRTFVIPAVSDQEPYHLRLQFRLDNFVGTFTVRNIKWEIGRVEAPEWSPSGYSRICGTLADCMTDEYCGTWFDVAADGEQGGVVSIPEQYTIDGAEGSLAPGSCVVWTGSRLIKADSPLSERFYHYGGGYEVYYRGAKIGTVNRDGIWSPELKTKTFTAYGDIGGSRDMPNNIKLLTGLLPPLSEGVLFSLKADASGSDNEFCVVLRCDWEIDEDNQIAWKAYVLTLGDSVHSSQLSFTADYIV